MNADKLLLRLRAFAADTPVSVAVPLGPTGTDGHKILPVLDLYHHGLTPGEVVHEAGCVEIHTTAWNGPDPLNVDHATVSDILARLEAHPEDHDVRVAVPNGSHHRVLPIETIGFAREAEDLGDGRLPLQFFTEPWEALNPIIRDNPKGS